jgi:adenine-specific DNA-methyltransferase
MIYIDPPYNTGNDFVYNDKFVVENEEYNLLSGQIDDEGGRLVANKESNGRFHSDWLSMIYPRLKLARTFLRDDGVIFISIDDNEIHNLRKICDEVFGEDNFVGQIVWEKMYTTKNDAAILSNAHEYILLYTKNIATNPIGLLPRTAEMDARYTNPDSDPRGNWKAIPLYAKGERKNGRYPVISPTTGKTHFPNADSHWLYAEDDTLKLIEDNRIYFGKDGNSQPNIKRFLTEVQQGAKAKTLWSHKEVGSNDTAKRELKQLYAGEVLPFDFPKPTSLINRMLILALQSNQNEIVLDFFSGSATTAHSVMQLNAEDGGNRKFIMVQIPEETDGKSEAYKAGYKTIPEIGKERIRRAGKKIQEDNAGKEGIENLDIGFRVLKVDSSNMKDVYYTPDELSKDSLFEDVENIKEDRTTEDLLFQVLLDWGVDLMLPIVREEILGKTVFFVDGDTLAACFDDGIDEAFVKELAKREMMRVVFKDSGFKEDDTKSNVEQIFTQLSPDTEVRAI